MKIVLVSSIPGVDMVDCMTNLLDFGDAKDKKIKWYKVEGEEGVHLINVATPTLDKSGAEKYDGDKYSFTQVLSLPLKYLYESCNTAFDLTIKQLKNDINNNDIDLAIICFHSTFYHLQTSEFAYPYSTKTIHECLQKHSLKIDWIISLQDDIYDVYRNLIKNNQLLNPVIRQNRTKKNKRKRLPLKDIRDLRFILDWRSRELTFTRNISLSIDTKHLLFHKKGRTKSLYEIIFENKPSVYLSHPISQPRRDILNITHEDKCKVPNKERGKNLIKEIEKLANSIGMRAPLIEPTAIDEYRIDLKYLESINTINLKEKILPPLNERWPISQGDRLGEINQNEQTLKLLPIESNIYDPEYFEFSETNFDASLNSAIETLIDEIKRQINVRDHILAAQASLIVAYRPFSLPDSSNPTGGVLEEINTLFRKIRMGEEVFNPAILIIHPEKDEKNRRKNEFINGFWSTVGKNALKLNTSEKLENLERGLLEIIVNINLSEEDVKVGVVKLLKNIDIEIDSSINDTTMPASEMAIDANLRNSFVEKLIKGTSIFVSPIHDMAKEYPREIVIISDDYKFSETKNILTTYK